VADFGIAKAAEAADLTLDGIMVGTAKYVAPEQVEGGPIDARTDLYALGVVLYEALCGRAPFTAETDAATALARLQRDPLRPRQIRASIPRPVEDVIMRSLARDPAGRYPDAASFRAALLSAGDAAEQFAGDDRAENRLRPIAPRGPDEAVPSFASSERSWLVPTTVIVLVAVALGVAGVLFGHTEAGRQFFDRVRNVAGAKTVQVSAQRVVSATAFDPFGDTPHERDDLVANAVDADPSTTWQTEHYNDPTFGRLKPGVGLVVSLAKPADLQKVTVTSPTAGWTAEVYAVDGTPPAKLAGWGTPLDRHENIAAGTTTFDLHGQKGSAVLIWITRLGPDGLAKIGDVKVTGAASS
jgi:hypothetical protein